MGGTFLQVLAEFTVILLLKIMNIGFAVYRRAPLREERDRERERERERVMDG